MNKNIRKITGLLSLFIVGTMIVGCSKTQSYSELLREEEEATNWFLANQEIITEIPADSVFQYGENAPYYRMDSDGYIYMQVINPGSKDNKAKDDELIYFRFLRTNLKYMYEGLDPEPEGNANDMSYGPASFRFNNLTLSSSAEYGTAVQLPLHYLGVDCEVNLVVRAYYGFTSEVGDCQPFIYNLRYYRSQM